MARINKAFKPKIVETEVEDAAPRLELERMYADAESEKDFIALFLQRLPKLTNAQAALVAELAAAFYRNGSGKPVQERVKVLRLVKDPKTEEERAQAALDRAQKRVARSQATLAFIEKRAVVRFAATYTFHQLWELGNKLGKENDHRVIADHTTKAQREDAGVEIE